MTQRPSQTGHKQMHTQAQPQTRPSQTHTLGLKIAALWALWCLTCLFLAGCGEPAKTWECQVTADDPDEASQIGCQADFDKLASEPLNSSIADTRSVKIVLDQIDDDKLHFQNSKRYKVHWDFASKHLSGKGLPIVLPLAQFSQNEYSSPARRFILGSLMYYGGPKIWAFEVAPWDTASAEMIAKAYEAIANATYFGKDLYFHPTSEAVTNVAKSLPSSIKIITTDELFQGTEYQALNLGTSMGRLRFLSAKEAETAYVSYRDIVVLDNVPNDISVTAGIITATFQTPLSHINVLSQNRGTPNMALKGADTRAELLALKDKWVQLEVKAFAYSIKEVTQAEADAWWEQHKPSQVQIPQLDTSVKDLRDAKEILDEALLATEGGLRKALDKAIPAFGGKASHYGGIARIGADCPVPPAFVIPVYYYQQFLTQHGFDKRIEAMLADTAFQGDPAVRDKQLAQLREDMQKAPIDAALITLLKAKLNKDFPSARVRFRSSTNAEDLGGFTGAGLYTSVSGELADPTKTIEDAIREVWASVWYFRAFEERTYRSIGHTSVGMALLVHRSFPDEEANGVALTANPFDSSGLEPGFYINVQKGEESVVKPKAGVTTDQFIYQFDRPGQPIVYITHSSLVSQGASVLTTSQVFALGKALDAIHKYFFKTYGLDEQGKQRTWYAMDVEFKFDAETGKTPILYMKQARPHPGRGN